MPNDPNAPTTKRPSIEEEASMWGLRWVSEELKAKIAEAKARNDMPLDSTPGNPKWENAADGHLDVPGDDGDEQRVNQPHELTPAESIISITFHADQRSNPTPIYTMTRFCPLTVSRFA
jgi:hypothetical protein